MIRHTDMEHTNMRTVLRISASGSKINSTVKVLKSGQMVLSTKDNILMVKSMVMANLHSLIKANTLDSS